MGSSMCGHVLDAGYAVTVYNRTRERAEPLLERGATWADSPAEVAAASDVVFSIVGYPDDVRAVILGEQGVLKGTAPGTVSVDMTTSEPSLAVEIYSAAKERGVDAIDAPVSGGDVGARNATLSIMVGGDEEPIERVRPLLETMGKTIVRQGGPGAGQHTKMVNQVLIATGMIGVCEALLYGYRAGLDLDTVLESVAERRRRLLVADELRPPHARRRLRAGLRRRSLRQGHGYRPRRGEAGKARAAGPRARGAALRRTAGPGAQAARARTR